MNIACEQHLLQPAALLVYAANKRKTCKSSTVAACAKPVMLQIIIKRMVLIALGATTVTRPHHLCKVWHC